MKAKLISDTETMLTFIVDVDVNEEEARQIVMVEGTYHKRSNGLWIVVKG